jgi:putative alpha-1,2-mannosidase
MDTDLRRTYGEDYLLRGLVEPITHTLDIAFGYQCTAKVARYVGDNQLATQLEGLASQWVNAFNRADGLLVDSTYYEGGKWNYSFRVLHDMKTRIGLAGGEGRFIELLDRFFGYGADPVKQLGELPSAADLAAGYALNRFEGLNNEPDMEAPWAYHYAGRPDRTAEVVHAAINNMFGLGPGGLPGNDDSGGLSSWYVWASLGLFPIAGQSLYLLNAPSFAQSRLALADQELVIDAPGFVEPVAGGPVQYVQNATFNGEELRRTWLTARELHRGGHLQLHLGSKPSTWGTTTRPPSASQPDAGYPPAAAATPAPGRTTDQHR